MFRGLRRLDPRGGFARLRAVHHLRGAPGAMAAAADIEKLADTRNPRVVAKQVGRGRHVRVRDPVGRRGDRRHGDQRQRQQPAEQTASGRVVACCFPLPDHHASPRFAAVAVPRVTPA